MKTTKRLKAITLQLTNRCNLACSYCYQGHLADRMPWEVARQALDLLFESPDNLVEVNFYGGEPLLEYETIERAVAYCHERRPASKFVKFSMTTNGLLLTAERIAMLDRERFSVDLSFDGVAGAQRFRGNGTFERLQPVFDEISKRPGFQRRRLGIGMTVASYNVDWLAESVRYIVERGFTRIGIKPLQTHDPGWDARRLSVLHDQMAAAFEFCRAFHERTGVMPVTNFIPTTPHPGARECGAGACSATLVDFKGDLYGCSFFIGSMRSGSTPVLDRHLVQLRRGNIAEPANIRSDRAYEKAVHGVPFFDFKGSKHTPVEDCRDCRYRDECHVCPLTGGYVPGNEDERLIPQFACEFNKATIRHRWLMRDQAALATAGA